MNATRSPLMKRSLPMFAVVALAACGGEQPASPGGKIAVTVKPLSLSGIGNAWYTIRVYGADPELGPAPLVAEIDSVDADRFGDGRGSLAYVVPCDGSSAYNWVELTLDELRDEGGGIVQADTWQNPTPVVKRAECVANRDTAVAFDLTIMRDAKQGFFDIAVEFEDVFCSAKFDCVDGDQQPLDLLFDPATGKRDTTGVLAFACTAGEGESTWLHMSDVYIECDADGDGGNPPTTYWNAPVGRPGNRGPMAPLFFETGLYMGEEQLPGVDKCYWNLAFGIAEGAPAGCKLVVDATASGESWLGRDGRSPEDAVYPYIHYEVPLTGAGGALACGRHALNGDDERVSTRYTGFSGASFPFEWRCGDAPPEETGRIACDGTIAALGSAGATFTQTPGGVSVSFGASRTRAYQLDKDLTIGDCCLNPCCTEPEP